MKPEFETRLRRDARADEREPTERMLAGLRAQLASERAPVVAHTDARSRYLVAAVILVAAGSLLWALNRLGRPDGEAPGVRAPIANVTTMPNAAADKLDTFAFVNPSAGLALAARASEPLEREWDHLVNDSKSVWRGLERQIPLITARE